MTVKDYFSQREGHSPDRDAEVVSAPAWVGLVGLVHSLIARGAFGYRFPELCEDGPAVIGTDEKMFAQAVVGAVPGLQWPLQTSGTLSDGFSYGPTAPDTLNVLDFMEFCYQSVAEPIQLKYHDHFSHFHLRFDRGVGTPEFRDEVNGIFARNALAYEMDASGRIIRLAPIAIQAQLLGRRFQTGDGPLDTMLDESRQKFLNPDPKVRREGLERLWDAWERLKSLQVPSDKKRSIVTLLERASTDKGFYELLDREAFELTSIGNTFHIRHSEATQTPLTDDDHVDYLFQRLFCLIYLLLKKR